jgi:excisionase family DNA binding protein
MSAAGDARHLAHLRRLEQRADLPRIAYSPGEFAVMTGLSDDQIRELLVAEEIPGYKFGNQWRIPADYVRQVEAGRPVDRRAS